MFCKHCGKEVLEESTFCGGCGNSVDDTKPQNINTNNSPSPKPSDWLCCPKCRSKKLQAVVESTVTGTGGGYSVGKGCLGSILLGPLGLLCGSGGKKQKINTTHQTMWLCHDCGNKFMNPEEQMKVAKSLMIMSAVSVVILPFLVTWMLNETRMSASDVRTVNIVIVISFAILGVIGFFGYKFAKAIYESMKNENK